MANHISVEVVAQPTMTTLADLLDGALQTGRYSTLDAAVAYVTGGGVGVLSNLFPTTGAIQTRWLTSIDWGRSEPWALEALAQRQGSIVRVHRGREVVASPGFAPAVSFHPKVFLLTGDTETLAIVGSGNLSRNGMLRSVEVSAVIAETKSRKGLPATIAGFKDWFDVEWAAASPLQDIHTEYRLLRSRSTTVGVPTEDDDVEATNSRRGFSAKEIAAMRSARHFWIEAGNLSRNLGPGLPGNQLMMRPRTRVFFGVPASAVEKMTPLSEVDIIFGGKTYSGLHMEHAHNGMDRLNLPKPGTEGPPTYDGETLCFERRAAHAKICYELTALSRGEARSIRQRSERQQMYFRMPGKDRQFGFVR